MPFTQIEEDMIQFGAVGSTELGVNMRQNLKHLSESVPVGEIVPIMVNIPGVPSPDPKFFLECNGTEILDENSLIRSTPGQRRFTPNLTSRYLKVPAGAGQVGLAGGSNFYSDLEHDHGGKTGVHTTTSDADPSNGTFNVAFQHDHTIEIDLDFSLNMEPPFYTLKFYMRIN